MMYLDHVLWMDRKQAILNFLHTILAVVKMQFI